MHETFLLHIVFIYRTPQSTYKPWGFLVCPPFFLSNLIILNFLLQPNGFHTPGSGRARRDAAARAMQGWHAQRLIGYGEISEPIIKVC